MGTSEIKLGFSSLNTNNNILHILNEQQGNSLPFY